MAMVASRNVVGVGEPDVDSVQGIRRVHNFLADPDNRESLQLECDLIGVIFNKNRATRRNREVVDEARAYWGAARVWEPIIKLREPIATAIDEAKPNQKIPEAEVRVMMTDAARAFAKRIKEAS
jgi:cellulose biosynthesis protein BcsQ